MRHYLVGEGNRGQLTRAADYLGCQRSYLSRVLLEEMHLTTDHAFKLSKFLNFAVEEREFFLALLESERAASMEYKSYWNQKIQEIKKRKESISERTSRQTLSIDNLQASYFSSWIWSAVHFLTSIPEYQTIASIANRLGIQQSQVAVILESLKSQDFISHSGTKWRYKSGEFHADKASPLVVFHHQNWRQRAVLDAQDLQNKSIHYTAVQTMSTEDAERIKALMFDFIRDASRIAGPSRPEEAVVITCDLFKV